MYRVQVNVSSWLAKIRMDEKTERHLVAVEETVLYGKIVRFG